MRVQAATGEALSVYPIRLTAPGMLAGSISLREVLVITASGKTSTQTVFGIYQLAGPILSFVQAGGPNLAAIRSVLVHAAEESAANLRSNT